MSKKNLPDKIVVASGNAHKIEEIKQIFKGVELISMHDAGFTADIEENGATFKENAYVKAKAVFDALHVPVLADDSGLCVDALGGAPGIYSARFSGGTTADNRALLLKRMDGISHRNARFTCSVCYIGADGKPTFGEGNTEGKILFEEIGEKGFGYDSLFFSYDLNKSFGEATEKEKNSVSHRFRALSDLRSKL
ncbi:MAG: RdgB/HAM1 family non-canonical purine NTP pyrophosphatase [Clostridia bacterium]|nr:RdgB/HAM1 family non-canonical purine NTP pyrophosphatase [Clostridia bacterium]